MQENGQQDLDVDCAFDEAEDQRPSDKSQNVSSIWDRSLTYLLGFRREDSKCGCVSRRWWWRPYSDVVWRLNVGVAGSLKFTGMMATSDDKMSIPCIVAANARQMYRGCFCDEARHPWT